MSYFPWLIFSHTFLHYTLRKQSIIKFVSGKFQQFDYGYLENLERYGQTEPPQYDLSKVTSPVALFYANNDWLVSEKVLVIILFHL